MAAYDAKISLESRCKMTEDSRVKRSLVQTSYKIFSIFYTKSRSIKTYINILGGLRVVSEDQIEGLSVEFDLG